MLGVVGTVIIAVLLIMQVLAAIAYFAEAGYRDGLTDERLNERCLEALGISYDDLLLMDEANQMPGVDQGDVIITPTRYLLFNDPLEGLCDYHLVPGETGKAFGENAKTLEKFGKIQYTYVGK